MVKHKTREAWLSAAVEALSPLFAAQGKELPPVKVSVGFPGGRGNKAGVIGQCWSGQASKDGVAQVFVSPTLGDASRVLDVLAHELVHAVNFSEGKSGHGAAFRKVATGIGLTGAMTATVASPELRFALRKMAGVLGDYPHAQLMPGSQPKQTTRMLKVFCPESGYTARTTAKWLSAYGAPVCPCCGETMKEG